jgi:hypothetical protein
VLPVAEAAEIAREEVRRTVIAELKERIESLEKLEAQVRVNQESSVITPDDESFT